MDDHPPKDHFAPATREALDQAKRLVTELKHTHITPEHMLLALLASHGGGVAMVLQQGSASGEQIRELVMHHLRPGAEVIPEHLITFSERGKRVLEAARQEAQRLRASQAAPEHLLAGLTLVPNTVCGAVLRAVGITTQAVRSVIG